MCDTLVALGNSTRDGAVIFAKNSDREPNEAHEVILFAAADHQPGATVKCTYIEVPQVAHTYAVLLARPFWIWGAEMGANEAGVTIGNEAVFTKVPYQKTAGLIGMDFIRLALERASTAEDALWVIVHLLEKYGQGGNCGFDHPFYYHNSFIIADTESAWVLETAGKFWAAEKVQDVRSISNALTIGARWDAASEGLVAYAIDKGWCKSKANFHFANCYSDFLYTTLGNSRKRRTCTLGAMTSDIGKINPAAMFQYLRFHSGGRAGNAGPSQALTGADVCMHAGFGPVRASQSVGSMVSHLKKGNCVHWVTATSAPCTSVFKPVWFDGGVPEIGPAPTGSFDPRSLFWQHEVLHRKMLSAYPERMAEFSTLRDALEAEFLQGALEQESNNPAAHLSFTRSCFGKAQAFENTWLEAAATIPDKRLNLFYQMAWNDYNKKSSMPDLEKIKVPQVN